MTHIDQDNATLSVETGAFSFLRTDRDLGWRSLALAITTDAGENRLAPNATDARGDRITLSGVHGESGVAESTCLTLADATRLTVERTLTNQSDHAVTVTDAGLVPATAAGGPVLGGTDVWHLRMAHVDNLRIERFPWCRPESPYVRNVPTTPTWFGNQESQALPVLLLTNDTYSELLLEGQLGQERTRVRWQLQAAPRALFNLYRLDWQFVGGGLLLAPGASVPLEPVYYELCTDTHPQHAATRYFDAAVTTNTFRAADKNVLTREAFYCSWNYGIMQNFTTDSLLRTAASIGEHLPHVRFFLIDGGWQGREAGPRCPDCSNFYLPESQWVDTDKIPGGMKDLADRIRDCGLRPSIWWTPSVSLSSTLAREHPEWLARDATGAPFRIGHAGYLDLARPEARAYLERVWEILFQQWGFEAMKMDFWCQAFESETIRYSHGLNMEWRDWLLKTLRSAIPDDGFLMTCVATAHGNIFLGKHAETYRCCIDVGNAAWHEHPLASVWVQPLLSIPGRRTTLLNVDGLGVNPALSDAENLHRLTYGFITMGSLEVDGRIEDLDPRHLDWLQRLTAHIDRGYPVACPDEDAFSGRPFPKVLYVDYPGDSPTRQRGIAKHVALFNWRDTDEYVGATAEALSLAGPVQARDFWTDATREISAEGLCERLPGRSARLYEIPV